MRLIRKIKKYMEKQEALQRLDAIEKEQKELRKIIEAPEKPKEITEVVKTFKDACNFLKLKTHKDAYNLIGMKRDYMCDVLIEDCEDSYLRLCILTLALNEGTEVDLTKETGYFPWFNHKSKPGSGFFYSLYDSWGTFSSVSARLALRTSKLALYSGNQFEQEHYNYMYN